MKSTKEFKEIIKSYLDIRSSEDKLFAVSYAKTDKNINDCITYILNAVKKSGCSGFADAEIYSMAVHYYDEDGIAIGKPITSKIVVNHTASHTVKLTSKDKEQAKADAMRQLQSEYCREMLQGAKPKPKVKAKKESDTHQPSLFD